MISELISVAFPKYHSYQNMINWDDIIKENNPILGNPDNDLSDIASIIYTSGTTGSPKGVMHKYFNFAFAIKHAFEVIDFNQNTRLFSYLPLSHIAERLLVQMGSIYSGGVVSFAESLDLFKENLIYAKPTIFLGVPRIWSKFKDGILVKINQKKLNLMLSVPFLSSLVKKKIKSQLGLGFTENTFCGAAAMPLDLLKWFKKYHNYNGKSWQTDLLSKRIISWISNTKITYEGSDEIYKNEFDYLIKKQVNHLINEIDRSEKIDDKIIGCAAIILAGASFNDKTKFLNYGLSLLNRIIRNTFDRYGFPKSRNLRQLTLFLKYFILIREWLKESQNDIPEYLDEIIYHLGQAYNLISKDSAATFLFNGSQISNNANFDNYLKRLGYNFKSESFEVGGYAFLNDKKLSLAIDLGATPEKKFSENYQAGTLSFEISYNGERIVSKMPVVRSIYSAIKQIMETVMSTNSNSFREVVLVQYPRKELWVIGFVTGSTK